MGLIDGALNLGGSLISGFFGMKKDKAELMKGVVNVLSDVNASQDARATAIATVISADSGSESWLTRTWRPIVVLTFTYELLRYFHGHVPPNIDKEIIMMLLGIVKTCLYGYIPARSIDKLINKGMVAMVLRKYIELQGK